MEISRESSHFILALNFVSTKDVHCLSGHKSNWPQKNKSFTLMKIVCCCCCVLFVFRE